MTLVAGSITKNVLEAWIARVSDAATGFNTAISASASTYGIDEFSIDFSADSQTFIQSTIGNLDKFLSSASVTFPLMTMEVSRGSNPRSQQIVKFHQFAGVLIGTCQVFLSFGESVAGVDFTSLPSCVVDCMYKTMNDTSISQPAAWPNGILYGGELDFNISPLVPGLEGFMKVVTFTATFRQVTR